MQKLNRLRGPALSSQRALRSRTTIQRTLADEAGAKAAPARNGQASSRGPFIAVAAVLTLVPGYYIFHSGRPAGVGHEAYAKARREGDPSQQYRDPRDSGVKTLEQKRQKEGK